MTTENQPATTVGIDSIKSLIRFSSNLGKAYDTASSDGKIDWKDSTVLIPLIPSAIEVLGSISNLKAQVSDLSSDEKAELVAFVKAEFDLADDKIEGYIEQALALLIQYGDVVAKTIALSLQKK